MRQLRAVLSRGRGALIYTALCLVILLLFRERAWQHVSTLNGDEWQPVQGFIRTNRQGEEPVCFLPSWTSGHATDQYKFRGIDVLEAPEEAWEGREEPLSGFWVVAQFGVFDPDDVSSDTYPHRGQVRLGGADVYLFRNEPFTLPESLALQIHEAQCYLQRPKNKRVELIFSRKGYIMPRNFPNRKQFSYLGCYAAEARFAGRAHHGIWFHPPPPRHSLIIEWPHLKLQPWIAVSGGLRDQIASRRGPDTHLAVLFDGKTIETLRFPTKRGWKTFAVELGVAPSTPGRLGFKVWTKNNNSRHFIFDVQLYGSRPEKALDPQAEQSSPTGTSPAGRRAKRLSGLRETDDGGTINEARAHVDAAEPDMTEEEARRRGPSSGSSSGD